MKFDQEFRHKYENREHISPRRNSTGPANSKILLKIKKNKVERKNKITYICEATQYFFYSVKAEMLSLPPWTYEHVCVYSWTNQLRVVSSQRIENKTETVAYFIYEETKRYKKNRENARGILLLFFLFSFDHENRSCMRLVFSEYATRGVWRSWVWLTAPHWPLKHVTSASFPFIQTFRVHPRAPC